MLWWCAFVLKCTGVNLNWKCFLNQFALLVRTGGWVTSSFPGRHILQIERWIECVAGHIIFVISLELRSGNFPVGTGGGLVFLFWFVALACCSCLLLWLAALACRFGLLFWLAVLSCRSGRPSMAGFRCQSLALRVTFANSSKSNQKCRALLLSPAGRCAILEITSAGGRANALPCAEALFAPSMALSTPGSSNF